MIDNERYACMILHEHMYDVLVTYIILIQSMYCNEFFLVIESQARGNYMCIYIYIPTYIYIDSTCD